MPNNEIHVGVTTGIAIVVTTLWAVSFTVDMASPSYSPNPGIHAIMSIVVGAIFGRQLYGNGKRGNGNGNGN